MAASLQQVIDDCHQRHESPEQRQQCVIEQTDPDQLPDHTWVVKESHSDRIKERPVSELMDGEYRHGVPAEEMQEWIQDEDNLNFTPINVGDERTGRQLERDPRRWNAVNGSHRLMFLRMKGEDTALTEDPVTGTIGLDDGRVKELEAWEWGDHEGYNLYRRMMILQDHYVNGPVEWVKIDGEPWIGKHNIPENQ